MSRTSRTRFRPAWMGRYNSMRDRYAANEITRHEFDAWHAAVQRAGDAAFEYRRCTAEHATTPYPTRDEFDTDDQHRAAIGAWVQLGKVAASCRDCMTDPPDGFGHGENS